MAFHLQGCPTSILLGRVSFPLGIRCISRGARSNEVMLTFDASFKPISSSATSSTPIPSSSSALSIMSSSSDWSPLAAVNTRSSYSDSVERLLFSDDPKADVDPDVFSSSTTRRLTLTPRLTLTTRWTLSFSSMRRAVCEPRIGRAGAISPESFCRCLTILTHRPHALQSSFFASLEDDEASPVPGHSSQLAIHGVKTTPIPRWSLQARRIHAPPDTILRPEPRSVCCTWIRERCGQRREYSGGDHAKDRGDVETRFSRSSSCPFRLVGRRGSASA